MNIFRRPKRESYRIEGADSRGQTVLDCNIADFSLPESVVLRLSEEFFNDPDPCEIHRAAVRTRAVLELVESCEAGKWTPLEALPDNQKDYLPAGVVRLRISRTDA